MKQAIRLSCLSFLWLWAGGASAKPAETLPLTIEQRDVDIAEIDRRRFKPTQAMGDTTWFVEWTFDNGSPCSEDGWTKVDSRIRNDGVVHWEVADGLSSFGALSGNAAVLGYDDPCCAEPGYDNDWYQALRLEYSGSGAVSFDYVLDSEGGFDFLQVEADSACASFDRVDYVTLPRTVAASYREILFTDSGFQMNGRADGVALPDFGTGDTHCLYVGFFSDGGFAPCDGLQPSSIGAALGVDNLELTGVDDPLSEDFEAVVDPRITFVNIQDSEPFGDWARVYPHATDNDPCTENTTCSWIFTDDTTPSLAQTPEMAFGPDGYVVRPWLENRIISPWVRLPASPDVVGTVVQFRRFGGQFFSVSRIVQRAEVRTRSSPTPPDTVGCPSRADAITGNFLSYFSWVTITRDVSRFVPSDAAEIQVRFRTSDWQWIANASPPANFNPGPGPYVDDVRIGRILLQGPAISTGIDARSQAQDAFPTEIDPMVTPAGEHFRPTTDRFGTAAFSSGADLARRGSPNLVTGDSIWVQVTDARGAGGIAGVDWYGAIVSGPHAGKAPPPWSVDANGFFRITPDSARASNGQIVDDVWYIDLDDDYFRGGDVLEYFWLARDGLGGVTSNPPGLQAEPSTLEGARAATNGLWEVSFLPVIDWDPGFVARIAADPHGDLEPTAEELTNSSQRSCVLYAQQTNIERRGGTLNRTTFMYSLDRVAGRGTYDVFDHQGLGDTNNHLGGRATVEQATGYSLIVYDAGNRDADGVILPAGLDLESQKVDQTGWFQQWLSSAQTSEAGLATLWILGTHAAEDAFSFTQNTMSAMPQLGGELGFNPNVDGQAAFTFVSEAGTASADFSDDHFNLATGCPARDYTVLNPTDGAVATHDYVRSVSGQTPGAAVVMSSNPTQRYNTILQTHPWADIQRPAGAPPDTPFPGNGVLLRVLTAVLPTDCQNFDGSTDVRDGDPDLHGVPQRHALHQNAPNPFNPTTTIAFDLARDGHVTLHVFDVAGRHVRTLVDEELSRQRYQVVWDGLDDAGARAPSGVYVYRIDTGGFVASRKMLLLK